MVAALGAGLAAVDPVAVSACAGGASAVVAIGAGEAASPEAAVPTGASPVATTVAWPVVRYTTSSARGDERQQA